MGKKWVFVLNILSRDNRSVTHTGVRSKEICSTHLQVQMLQLPEQKILCLYLKRCYQPDFCTNVAFVASNLQDGFDPYVS